jgi:hypothetical protein
MICTTDELLDVIKRTIQRLTPEEKAELREALSSRMLADQRKGVHRFQ